MAAFFPGILAAQEWQYATADGEGYSYDANGVYTDSRGFSAFSSLNLDGANYSGMESVSVNTVHADRFPIMKSELGLTAYAPSVLSIEKSSIIDSDFRNLKISGTSNYDLYGFYISEDSSLENVDFSGRSISATHVAFCSTRVMGTCGIVGQAVGTAAAVAIAHGLSPRAACRDQIDRIRELLLGDDCFLPHYRRKISKLCQTAALDSPAGNPEALRNGIDRRYAGTDNGFFGKLNQPITYSFGKKVKLSSFRLITDSDLDREFVEGNPNLVKIPMPLFHAQSYNGTSFGFPACMLKKFRLEIPSADGGWKSVYEKDNNIMRLVRGTLNVETEAIRLVPQETWASARLYHTYGSGSIHLFAFEVNE